MEQMERQGRRMARHCCQRGMLSEANHELIQLDPSTLYKPAQ